MIRPTQMKVFTTSHAVKRTLPSKVQKVKTHVQELSTKGVTDVATQLAHAKSLPSNQRSRFWQKHDVEKLLGKKKRLGLVVPIANIAK